VAAVCHGLLALEDHMVGSVFCVEFQYGGEQNKTRSTREERGITILHRGSCGEAKEEGRNV
jgi:hypothetical protein